jgi:hypothetical protein
MHFTKNRGFSARRGVGSLFPRLLAGPRGDDPLHVGRFDLEDRVNGLVGGQRGERDVTAAILRVARIAAIFLFHPIHSTNTIKRDKFRDQATKAMISV